VLDSEDGSLRQDHQRHEDGENATSRADIKTLVSLHQATG
jgi:hypothetical protein